MCSIKMSQRRVVIWASILKKKLQKFWADLSSSPEGRDYRNIHPFLQGRPPAQLRFSLPCTLHEDAGTYSKTKSCNIVSWSSILGLGTEAEIKHPTFTHLKQAGEEVPVPVWRKY